ncbi:hypothetical protein SD457_00310 [Coprobacillaceae bacterium CR2/5/TPMF4]|nr:hypothetical protein SD457_00310 [Coprobacillaceae bacterium CR2/5/TPMF4]
MESLLNEDHSIVHSTGVIVNSKLIVQEGPLMGKEEMIKKLIVIKELLFR